MHIKRIISVLLTFTITLGLIAFAPLTVSAATLTAGTSAALTTALANAKSGDVIQLTASFTHNAEIVIDNKNITFDLNTRTLTVNNADGNALTVKNNGVVNLTGTGALYVYGNGASCLATLSPPAAARA